jgi:hypothetical protein
MNWVDFDPPDGGVLLVVKKRKTVQYREEPDDFTA